MRPQAEDHEKAADDQKPDPPPGRGRAAGNRLQIVDDGEFVPHAATACRLACATEPGDDLVAWAIRRDASLVDDENPASPG